MKLRLILLSILLASIAAGSFVAGYKLRPMVNPLVVSVYFSPRGGTTAAIIKQIDGAKHKIVVSTYSFTSDPIAQALLKARSNGVDITVVSDSDQRDDKNSVVRELSSKMPVYLDAKHAIHHNKIIVIDGEIVITGSFNFTKSAEEKNAENCLVIHSAELAAIYLSEFQKHLSHSERLNPG
jgi:phosphatidylserine/phosphatidylglycerophosphate/cardiolipin synthase-like enzyme